MEIRVKSGSPCLDPRADSTNQRGSRFLRCRNVLEENRKPTFPHVSLEPRADSTYQRGSRFLRCRNVLEENRKPTFPHVALIGLS
jgi:hypothetical protein